MCVSVCVREGCVWGRGLECVSLLFDINSCAFLLSSAAQLGISNGTTVAAEPANDPAVITQKIETKRGGEKKQSTEKKASSSRANLPAGWRCSSAVCL